MSQTSLEDRNNAQRIEKYAPVGGGDNHHSLPLPPPPPLPPATIATTTTTTTTTTTAAAAVETANQSDALRARPASWHPSTPVEPPTQLRPIAVHAILNPPDRALMDSRGSSLSREPLDFKLSASPSPHLQQGSSPLPHPIHPPPPPHHHHHHHHHHHQHPPSILQQQQQRKQSPLSPGTRPRRIITPVSPSARLVGAGARHTAYPGKVSVSQSPFVQEQLGGLYHTSAPASPLPIEPTIAPAVSLPAVIAQPSPASLHSTPTFHSRRISAGLATNPSSQETSPSTPHSAFSHFGHSSPAAGSVPPPGLPHQSLINSSPYAPMAEPLSRVPSVLGSVRLPALTGGGEEQQQHHHHHHQQQQQQQQQPATTLLPGHSNPSSDQPPAAGMIPCILDLKSGSSSQAEKRKANSDASRRFRNRKKNEMQMEQKLAAQQDELRSQTETIQQQGDEIRELLKERDHYRSERDFYRERLSRAVPMQQLPARPPSPRRYHSAQVSPEIGHPGHAQLDRYHHRSL
ncbi:hypothetical protein ASPZODRAFT_134639 [Penicilliopsis zonata CBS 506.65]|uniref:BZIP domain-containing protein n=1 Tax=Penicilliopsis zonata CBS 506.65 TaxID=1073090 RepID=A0A1L9SBM9_9EURO|nr:hypothetical protein ASPZODRAFT_134639 [Penicilliopsis zonata CBS 506.65]OJJ44563.1 hypothetical protein ASPZODRAFT_134639 [Penicilliopsis zonata CBS 506.65]